MQFGLLKNNDGLTAAQLAPELRIYRSTSLVRDSCACSCSYHTISCDFSCFCGSRATTDCTSMFADHYSATSGTTSGTASSALFCCHSTYACPVFSVSSPSFSSGPTITSQIGHASLCDNCAKLTRQNNELSAELNRVKEQNASLLSQYQTAMEAVASTQNANSNFMAQITESQSTIARLEAELEKQKALVRSSSSESTALMLQVSTSSTHVNSLQSELHLKDEEIKMLRAKVAELEENTTEIIRMTENAINARATVVANQLASQQEERTFLQASFGWKQRTLNLWPSWQHLSLQLILWYKVRQQHRSKTLIC